MPVSAPDRVMRQLEIDINNLIFGHLPNLGLKKSVELQKAVADILKPAVLRSKEPMFCRLCLGNIFELGVAPLGVYPYSACYRCFREAVEARRRFGND